MAQALSVVHIFISGKSPKYGLPQHPDQSMSAILASACVGERITRHRNAARAEMDKAAIDIAGALMRLSEYSAGALFDASRNRAA